jgi:hypothetical protein
MDQGNDEKRGRFSVCVCVFIQSRTLGVEVEVQVGSNQQERNLGTEETRAAPRTYESEKDCGGGQVVMIRKSAGDSDGPDFRCSGRVGRGRHVLLGIGRQGRIETK